ncbi:MAG TPA: YebB family permuted papain-like enzyme [Rhodocyclaceae bacterium]|nr:YebB family permuted papain-like enzyme [Rhodocyclaceae bacterium]
MFRNIDSLCLGQLRPGDVVFIRVPALLFLKVAEASESWSNHVGVIVGHDGTDWIIAESCLPCVRRRRFQDFVARSENGSFVIRRLPRPLTEVEQIRLRIAADSRMGQLYHTGFRLRSRRQFCSKFVHEVLAEACGEEIGEVETFETLLRRNPQTSLRFWRIWFFGRIPWQRETITPDSLLRSSRLHTLTAS